MRWSCLVIHVRSISGSFGIPGSCFSHSRVKQCLLVFSFRQGFRRTSRDTWRSRLFIRALLTPAPGLVVRRGDRRPARRKYRQEALFRMPEVPEKRPFYCPAHVWPLVVRSGRLVSACHVVLGTAEPWPGISHITRTCKMMRQNAWIQGQIRSSLF